MSLLTWLLAAAAASATVPSLASRRDPAPQRLTVVAHDYTFEAPDRIPAGLTTVQLINRGQDLHHVLFVRLDEGKTLPDLVTAMKEHGPLPKWAVLVGGPNAPAPGAEANATMVLTPGTYAILCVIPAPDGVPHVMKGMVRELTVTGAGTPAALPAVDVVALSLTEYDFTLSRPLTAGRHVIRVRNGGGQPHEVELFRLRPGHTAADVLAWVDGRQGEPPAIPIGGVNSLAPGLENDFSVELTRGNYALVCFFPDAGDGKPHFTHGMVKQITVPSR